MEIKNIESIKKFEGPPKVIKIFSEEEIKSILKLYESLPVTVNNKKPVSYTHLPLPTKA